MEGHSFWKGAHMVEGEACELEGGEVGEGQRQQRPQGHADSAEADKERTGPGAVLVRHKNCDVAPVHCPGRACMSKCLNSLYQSNAGKP